VEQIKYQNCFFAIIFYKFIFGSNFSLFHGSTEIAFKRKNTIVVHLYSLERLKEVFELNGMNMFVMKKDDRTIMVVVPKIIIDMDGKEGIGIVKKKINGYLNILLENGQELNVWKPEFDCEIGIWKLYNDDSIKIKEIHLFRMKILKNQDLFTSSLINSI
jgi:hypothetical protein